MKIEKTEKILLYVFGVSILFCFAVAILQQKLNHEELITVLNQPYEIEGNITAEESE